MHINVMAQQHLKCQPVLRQQQGTTFRPFQQSSRHTNLSHIHKPTAHNRRSSLLMTAGGAGLWLAAGGVVAAGAAAAAGLFGGSSPQDLVRVGMQKFRKNDVEGSVQDFDAALAMQPQMRPFLWQRGLSLYYLGDFQQAAQQFRDDVAVNPNDTEESIWAFLCEAQMQGTEAARDNMLKVGRDPRPVMRAVYDCFRTAGLKPDTILQAAGPGQGSHDAFYAWLYVGLWHEAHGDAEQARAAVTQAVGTQYAKQSGDYMASLARVHCLRRGWPLEG